MGKPDDKTQRLEAWYAASRPARVYDGPPPSEPMPMGLLEQLAWLLAPGFDEHGNELPPLIDRETYKRLLDATNAPRGFEGSPPLLPPEARVRNAWRFSRLTRDIQRHVEATMPDAPTASLKAQPQRSE